MQRDERRGQESSSQSEIPLSLHRHQNFRARPQDTVGQNSSSWLVDLQWRFHYE